MFLFLSFSIFEGFHVLVHTVLQVLRSSSKFFCSMFPIPCFRVPVPRAHLQCHSAAARGRSSSHSQKSLVEAAPGRRKMRRRGKCEANHCRLYTSIYYCTVYMQGSLAYQIKIVSLRQNKGPKTYFKIPICHPTSTFISLTRLT